MTNRTEIKKKILFLITKSNWGGAQRYVYDLATSLPTDQFEVVVALGGDGPLTEKLQAADVTVVHIPGLQRDVSLTAEVKASKEMYRIIKTEQPDILHLNSSKAGAIGALLGRIARVPRIIFTAHGWAFNEDRSVISKLLIGFIHWLTVILSHHTIAVSEGMKVQLRGPWVQQKMTVIHPGRDILDMKSKSEARDELAQHLTRLHEYKEDTWIGTVAELHPIKRLHRAIDAMATLVKDHPNLRYVIVSHGELFTELAAQIKSLDLEHHVFLTGLVPEAGRLMKAFDIFVLPSKSESYGYVLVEAGQAGLPVVATRTGGITDLVTDEGNGLLVPVDDTNALTQAVSRLLRDESLCANLAAAHQELMNKKTTGAMAAATILVYQS